MDSSYTSICLFCNSPFTYCLSQVTEERYLSSVDELRQLKIMILSDFKISYDSKPFFKTPSSLPVCAKCTPEIRSYLRLKIQSEEIQQRISEKKLRFVTRIVENFIDDEPTEIENPFIELLYNIFLKWRFRLLNNHSNNDSGRSTPTDQKNQIETNQINGGFSSNDSNFLRQKSKRIEATPSSSKNLLNASKSIINIETGPSSSVNAVSNPDLKLSRNSPTKKVENLPEENKNSSQTQEGSEVNIEEFKCKLCSKAFTNSASLNKHISYHTRKKIPCSVCKKEFLNNLMIKHHLQRTPSCQNVLKMVGKNQYQKRFSIRNSSRNQSPIASTSKIESQKEPESEKVTDEKSKSNSKESPAQNSEKEKQSSPFETITKDEAELYSNAIIDQVATNNASEIVYASTVSNARPMAKSTQIKNASLKNFTSITKAKEKRKKRKKSKKHLFAHNKIHVANLRRNILRRGEKVTDGTHVAQNEKEASKSNEKSENLPQNVETRSKILTRKTELKFKKSIFHPSKLSKIPYTSVSLENKRFKMRKSYESLGSCVFTDQFLVSRLQNKYVFLKNLNFEMKLRSERLHSAQMSSYMKNRKKIQEDSKEAENKNTETSRNSNRVRKQKEFPDFTSQIKNKRGLDKNAVKRKYQKRVKLANGQDQDDKMNVKKQKTMPKISNNLFKRPNSPKVPPLRISLNGTLVKKRKKYKLREKKAHHETAKNLASTKKKPAIVKSAIKSKSLNLPPSGQRSEIRDSDQNSVKMGGNNNKNSAELNWSVEIEPIDNHNKKTSLQSSPVRITLDKGQSYAKKEVSCSNGKNSDNLDAENNMGDFPIIESVTSLAPGYETAASTSPSLKISTYFTPQSQQNSVKIEQILNRSHLTDVELVEIESPSSEINGNCATKNGLGNGSPTLPTRTYFKNANIEVSFVPNSEKNYETGFN